MSNIKKIRFRIAGTQYYEKDFVEQLGKRDPDYDCSASELKEAYYDGDKIYEYDFSGLKAELIPEPDNEHDPNAVKVVANGVQVGYIKKGSCTRVKNLMKLSDFAGVDVSISGGKYKYICEYEDDNGNEKVRVDKGEQPFYVDIDILIKEDAEDIAPVQPTPVSSVSHYEPAAPKKPILGRPTRIIIIAAVVILLCLFIMARL